MLFKLFDAQIVPVLLYGSELWACFNCPNVEKVHIYACKRIRGISSQRPNHMIYSELGRHHLSVLASTRCVKYWLRLNKISSSRHMKMVYNMWKSMAGEGKENWASVVEDLLCTNNFASAWGMDQCETKHVSWLNSSSVLQTVSFKTWHFRMVTSERYELYRTVKSALEKEKISGHDIQPANKENLHKVQARDQPDTNAQASVGENAVMLRCPLCNGETENEVH